VQCAFCFTEILPKCLAAFVSVTLEKRLNFTALNYGYFDLQGITEQELDHEEDSRDDGAKSATRQSRRDSVWWWMATACGWPR
jgi:hypothetical protein